MNEWSTMKKLIWLKRTALGGIPFVWKTESGEAPLTLEGALAKHIKSLTQYGLCTQASTPTPTDPVPIVCNNGTLSMVKPSGLPVGFDLVEWIMIAGAGIGFGYKTTQDIEIEAQFFRIENNPQTLYQSDASADRTTNTSAYVTNGGNWRMGDTTVVLQIPISNDLYTSVQNKEGVWLNGEKVGTYTSGVGTFTSSADFRTSYGSCLKYVRITVRSYSTHAVQHDYLPCKRKSDNAYGFYDLIVGEFVTNDSSTITAGNAVSDPMSLAVVGTPESISITASGAETQTATAESLFAVETDADEQEIIHGAIKRKVGVKVLDGTEDWMVTGAGVYSFRLGEATGTAWRKEAISTHYVGTDATTANMPNDSVKCATNTEGTIYSLYIKPSAYPSSSANTWKAYVAAQYAAGTPIIAVYPLAEETAESVTPQHLTTADGDNTVSVSANVSPISLKVEYAGVSS